MMAPVALLGPAFLVAAICAAVMGYAIQRGATCMVAAIDEAVNQRRATRLVALVEAGVWVAGGLMVATLLGDLPMSPLGHEIAVTTVAGGGLLGIGALVNRACVFGAIARLGSGEWAYILTPLGFFIGCLVVDRLMVHTPATAGHSPIFAAAAVLVVPFGLFAGWRGVEAWQAMRRRAFARHIWTPHRATMIIGIAFVVMMLTVGSWAYTEALAAAARGMAPDVPPKLILFAALLAGALAGGWTAGRLRAVAPTRPAMLRCLAGGALMGAGSTLVPGSNDGLILLGLPLLQPHAAVALISMVIAIAGGMLVESRLARR